MEKIILLILVFVLIGMYVWKEFTVREMEKTNQTIIDAVRAGADITVDGVLFKRTDKGDD